MVVYSPNWKSGKIVTAASLRENLSFSSNIMQLDQPQPNSCPNGATSGHRRNQKKVRMQMYGNGDEEMHFLFLQSLINRLQHSHVHSHLMTRRNIRTTKSSRSSILKKKSVSYLIALNTSCKLIMLYYPLCYCTVMGCSVSLKYNQQDATFPQSIYFYKLLYMFQAVPPPIIRST
jgi:hypothetical protein